MTKKIILLVAILVSVNSFSQKNNISPYSFFGIGQINESKTTNEQAMAVGTALSSTHNLYFNNPASLGSLRLTTYTLGATNFFTKIDDGTNQQSASAFSLSYLALGFPIGEKAGLAFGVQPFSKVGYSIMNTYKNDSDETESNLYEGKGSTNRVFLGFGHKLPYHTSIGVEASYVFGNLEKTILWRNNDRLDQRATYYKTDSKVGGFALKFGAQNTYKINDKLDLKSGISLLLENKLNHDGTEKLTSLANLATPDIIIYGNDKDEILNKSFDGDVKMPLKTAISVGLGKTDKWFAGLEYEFKDATTFTEGFTQNNNFINYIKTTNLAFGGFYTPKAESITSYWDRVTYRAGVHLKQTGLEINHTAIKDFGMSFGVSLPSRRQISSINLGFDIGKKGEINDNGLIKENYYNFRLSLSLNDKWFRKRKLD